MKSIFKILTFILLFLSFLNAKNYILYLGLNPVFEEDSCIEEMPDLKIHHYKDSVYYIEQTIEYDGEKSNFRVYYILDTDKEIERFVYPKRTLFADSCGGTLPFITHIIDFKHKLNKKLYNYSDSDTDIESCTGTEVCSSSITSDEFFDKKTEPSYEKCSNQGKSVSFCNTPISSDFYTAYNYTYGHTFCSEDEPYAVIPDDFNPSYGWEGFKCVGCKKDEIYSPKINKCISACKKDEIFNRDTGLCEKSICEKKNLGSFKKVNSLMSNTYNNDNLEIGDSNKIELPSVDSKCYDNGKDIYCDDEYKCVVNCENGDIALNDIKECEKLILQIPHSKPKPKKPDTGKPNQPKKPDTGKPNKPNKDNNSSLKPNQPKKPDTGKPNKPNKDNNSSLKPNQPKKPDTGKPNKPNKDNNSSLKPNQPKKPDTGKPSKPNQPNKPDTGKPNKPNQPNKDNNSSLKPNKPNKPDIGKSDKIQSKENESKGDDNDTIISLLKSINDNVSGISKDIDKAGKKLDEMKNDNFFNIKDSLEDYDFESDINDSLKEFNKVEVLIDDFKKMIENDSIPKIKKFSSVTSCPITAEFQSPKINKTITWDLCKVLYPYRDFFYILFYLIFMIFYSFACFKILIFIFLGINK